MTLIQRLLRRETNKSETHEASEIIIEDEKLSTWPYMVNCLFYLSVILFIGIPMWFYTCSATRYPLPNLSELEEALAKSENSPPKLHLDISVIQLAKFDATKADEESALNHVNDRQTDFLRANLPKQIATSVSNVTYNINWRVRRPTQEEHNIFLNYEYTQDSGADFNSRLVNLEKELLKIHRTSNKFRLFLYLIDESQYSHFCDSKRAHSYTIGFERFVYLCPSTATQVNSDYSHMVTLIGNVLEQIFANTVEWRKVKHILRSRLELLFSIVPEVSDSSHLIDSQSKLVDKIHSIHDKNVRQLFPELLELANIRVTSHYMVELLDEEPLNTLIQKPAKKNLNENDTTIDEPRSIKIDKMGSSFHYFQSKMDQHSSQDVHNVLVIKPNSTDIFFSTKTQKQQLPLLEVDESNSVLIANDDRTIVLGLRALVRKAVGLYNPNLCNSCLVRRDVFFNRWEIDAVMGALTIIKLQDTLTTLRSISQQNIGVKIPKDVSKTANEAYNSALKSLEYLETKMTHDSYRLASRAYELSESAFYDPSLLESLYFPDELKYAIYMPFFLPLVMPFIKSLRGLLKYLTEYIRSRRNLKSKIN